ncbi:PepSY domain-containing protein [uncultured Lactobacillus sp.]|uniref:PepSY domain-containing protein n=1 Tax=uncultured Lactobacillus sp. TaxID=153152 RepID=UPI00260EEB52|nr:PepSY domain-containing protein [uncultured Lactobacillus sp.]
MKQNKTLIKLASSVALTGALVLGATACSNNSNESSSQSSKVSKAKKNTKKAVKQNETKLKRAKIQVSQQSALNKFNEKYPDTEIKELDLKLENNNYVYEIDGFDKTKEYSATIDANDGRLIHSSSEKLDLDELNQKALNFDSLISRDEATKIAEKNATGVGKEWNLEQDHDIAYWNVKVSDGTKTTEVKIDAQTKKVISTKNDD